MIEEIGAFQSMIEQLNGWEPIGYTWDKRVLFRKDGEYIALKDTLRKQDLILKLKVRAEDVSSVLRDDILTVAAAGGSWDLKAVKGTTQLIWMKQRG